MRRVWLHIGMQKTGTSAAQSWMTENAASLHTKGLLYLRPKKNLPASGALVDALVRKPEKAAALISAMLRQLENCEPDVTDALISSEDFSAFPASAFLPLMAALADQDVRVLVWLRRQDMFAESLVKQWIKWNGHVAANRAAVLRQAVWPLLNYHQMLDDWARTFPSATIVPYVYEEPSDGHPQPDSIAAVLHAVGFPHLTPEWSESYRRNVSPCAQLVEHYQTIHDHKRLREANREFMRLHPDTFSGRGDLFSDDERRQILDYWAESNEELRQRWFPNRRMLFQPFAPSVPSAMGSEHEAVNSFRKVFAAKQH